MPLFLGLVGSKEICHPNLETENELSELLKKAAKFKAPFSSRKFSTLSKIQNMKIFNVF